MSIESYDDLLREARAQPEPQRLLFVFAKAVLPEHNTPEQRSGFAAGQGGAIEPMMSVDKSPEELGSFSALVEESDRFGPGWSIVFVSALAGRNGRAPTTDESDRSLQRMIESIKGGSFGSCIPFDRHGAPVLLSLRP